MKALTKASQLKRPRYKREKRVPRIVPVDGIERKPPKNGEGHTRIIPVTPEAKGLIYDDLFARSGGKCMAKGCRAVIYRDTFHPHHFKGRTRGRKCWCLECLQALCPTVRLQDGTLRIGCHDLTHLTIDEQGKFDATKSVRLGKPFAREAVTRSKD